MASHGLHGWAFAFNGMKRTCGYCYHPTRTRSGRIELSVHYTENNTLEQIRDTVLHEIAHALVGPQHGHDATWKRKCIEIGAKPERCNRGADMPKGKWRATCPGCQRLYSRHKKPRTPTGYFCRTCGSVRGQLVFREEV
jgi:predicted SprT family Zn-dependent metalloprotease